MKYRKSHRSMPVPGEKTDRISYRTQQIIAGSVSRSDPNGSYTGLPLDPEEIPVQDADDL